MFARERHHAIIQIVRQHRRMEFADLQRLVPVTPATLRRDLAGLERAGKILRVHGGVLDPAYARSEISFDERLLKNSAAKKTIAATAAALIPPGASVLVDAGSTCLEAGKALLGRKDVRIITHSVALVTAGLHGEADILCLGGQLRKVSSALTGTEALGSLENLHADWAFIGASGLHPTAGCSTTELSEAGIKNALLARATHKVLLADLSKWNQQSTVRFADWKDFAHWVTDLPPEPREKKSLIAQGLTIHSGSR